MPHTLVHSAHSARPPQRMTPDLVVRKQGIKIGLRLKFEMPFENESSSTACAGVLEAKLGNRFNLADPGEVAKYLSAGGCEVCAAVIVNAVLNAAELIRNKS